MELSAIELEYVIKEINNKILQGYYVSNIINVTKDSFLFKLHHITHNDLILMISTKAIWLTNFKFKNIEENDFSKTLTRELERLRIEKIESVTGERIIKIIFTKNDFKRILICEFFGTGNLILCDDSLKIIGQLHQLEVRHRIIKPGVIYELPPLKGIDSETISLEKFTELIRTENQDMLITKWIGRTFALPRKFSEEIVIRSNVEGLTLADIHDKKIELLYNTAKSIIESIRTGNNHNPIIIIDENKDYVEISPILLESKDEASFKHISSFIDAIDEVFSGSILNTSKRLKASEIEKQISILQHDLMQQEQAKESVIYKAKEIRKLAAYLMSIYQSGNLKFEDEVRLQLPQFSSKIITDKGTSYLIIQDERIPMSDNLPKMSSLLYATAKELERGSSSIDEAKEKLIKKINQLHSKSISIQKKVEVKQQMTKEWFERYRWFITNDGLLAIGGRDASSNSAIIRKHLTEKDIVFHAEIHGSPFFILKEASELIEKVPDSMQQVAQATVSFSRAWKDSLSSGDCFWITPDQVKKGAPTGQSLAKGSFVIEGKRNYIKGLEIKLAFGITQLEKQYRIICGPIDTIKRNGIVYVSLLPQGLDPMNLAKKIKSELIKVAEKNEILHIVDYIKALSIEDIIRACPQGKSKITGSGIGNSSLA